MNKWFGEPWGAPVNTDCPRVETPVGVPCLRCALAIKDGDQGFVMPYMSGDPHVTIGAYHLDCMMKSVLNHQFWPTHGLTPDVFDGFEPTGHDSDVMCPICKMTYSYTQERWL